MMDEYQAPKIPAAPWLRKIEQAEKAFDAYHRQVENVERLYASGERLSGATEDREYQIFWANMEVLRPTIYQRSPKPVVTTRRKGAPKLHRTAADVLERALAHDVEADDLHDALLHVRDDMAIGGRGVVWVLDNASAVHVDRRDFLHEPARKWSEVSWVARRAFLTMDQVKARFPDCDTTALHKEPMGQKDDNGSTSYFPADEKKVPVWEIWSKAEQAVVWVASGPDYCLDARPPLFDVKGFFPCPRPAYGTLEPRKLIPVPDFAYYRDQVDEINTLTQRIAALSESLRLKGFYAGGASDIGEAVEAAMRNTNDKAVLIPVPNLAALGGSAAAAIVWMPLDAVIATITSMIALRQQLIQDVYQITGLSDIMRGASDPNETARAQTLKAQYGSVRVREKQLEMERIARDVFRIKAEVFAENVPAAELAEMGQVTVPSMMQIQMQAQGQPIPPDVVTIEAVDQLLKDQRTRPFVLDVESDSTIGPDEEAEKASRIEFVTAVGALIREAGPFVAQQPQIGPFMGEMLKFVSQSFRAGRDMSDAIEKLVADMSQAPAQQQGPSPEQQMAQAELQMKQQEMQLKQQEMQADMQIEMAKIELEREKLALERMKLEIEARRAVLPLAA